MRVPTFDFKKRAIEQKEHWQLADLPQADRLGTNVPPLNWNSFELDQIVDNINSELGFRPFVELSQIAKKVIETEDFERLKKVNQLSSIYYTAFGINSDHSRAVHCIVAYILGKNIAIKARMTEQEVEECGLVCLLHDIGHPAFQHMGEAFLKQNFNRDFDHDLYAREVISGGSIGQILSRYGYSVDKICEAISDEQKTAIHEIKDCADRGSYIILDSYNSPLDKEVKYHALNMFRRIKPRVIDNRLVFKTVVEPRALLDYRQLIFSNFSCSPVSALTREITFRALRQAQDSGKLKPEELLKRGDDEIIQKFDVMYKRYFGERIDHVFNSYLAWIVPENKADPVTIREELQAKFEGNDMLKDLVIVGLTEDTYKKWEICISSGKGKYEEKKLVSEGGRQPRILFIACRTDILRNYEIGVLIERTVLNYSRSRQNTLFLDPNQACRENIFDKFVHPEFMSSLWLNLIGNGTKKGLFECFMSGKLN